MFEHAYLFHLITLLVCAIFCSIAGERRAWCLLGIVSYLYVMGQTPMWEEPTRLFVIHISALAWGLATFSDYEKILIIRSRPFNLTKFQLEIFLFMLVADAAWIGMPLWGIPENALYFPYHVWWLQNLLGLCFFLLCLSLLVWCYTTHKFNKIRGKTKHAFYAMVGVVKALVRKAAKV